MINIVSLADINLALKDEAFRRTLPEIFKEDIKKYLNNPGCGCNVQFYKKLLKEAKEELKKYYPDKEIVEEEEQIKKLAQNNFSVINCGINELENILQKLGPGRMQIAIARYQDEVTVIINNLDLIY